jgi:hypothetical protein
MLKKLKQIFRFNTGNVQLAKTSQTPRTNRKYSNLKHNLRLPLLQPASHRASLSNIRPFTRSTSSQTTHPQLQLQKPNRQHELLMETGRLKTGAQLKHGHRAFFGVFVHTNRAELNQTQLPHSFKQEPSQKNSNSSKKRHENFFSQHKTAQSALDLHSKLVLGPMQTFSHKLICELIRTSQILKACRVFELEPGQARQSRVFRLGLFIL